MCLSKSSTRDLYRKHPTIPDHWIYHGRADNIIIFSNGEKLNPVSIGSTVAAHPGVKGALVVGTMHFQPALIIEPARSYPRTKQEAEAFIEHVLPLVVQANRQTVTHGQIGRKFVALSNPDNPFLRSGKGAIQRPATLKLYEEEIDRIYKRAGALSSCEAKKIDVSSEETLMKSIIDVFTHSLDMEAAAKLGPDTDFFAAGIDSLQVINASRLLRGSLQAEGIRASAPKLATRVIYENLTPRRLAHYLYTVVKEGDASSGSAAENEIHAVESQIAKCTADKPPPLDDKQTVLLTGPTEALGSCLLDMMLSSPTDSQKSDLPQPQRRRPHPPAPRERGTRPGHRLRQSRVPPRRPRPVQLGTADARLRRHPERSRPHHPQPVARQLQHVGRVLRAARAGRPPSGRPQRDSEEAGAGRLCLEDQCRRRLEATVSRARGVQPRPDACCAERVGAVQARQRPYPGGRHAGVRCPVRDHQGRSDGGPEADKGVWNRQEWLPSIVASSVSLGVLPSDLGVMDVVDWTPIERIARMVLEVSGVATRVPISEVKGYFHGVNPETTTWDKLAPAVQEFYGGRIKRLLPFSEWIKAVEKIAAEKADHVRDVPAIKLLNTDTAWDGAKFSGQKHVDFAITRTKSRSEAMADSKAITPELIKNWSRQWAF